MRKLKDVEPPTTEAVMAVFGGMPQVRQLVWEARGKNVSQQRVQHWKYKNKFPANTYLLFKLALEEKGFRAPAELWGQIAESEIAAE
jgi:hypothetical protein